MAMEKVKITQKPMTKAIQITIFLKLLQLKGKSEAKTWYIGDTLLTLLILGYKSRCYKKQN